ncbi:MAG: hypothetical protein IH852_10125 [Bacteroidetes bacterium]|nr:hypothetical protein [Bacteroidota bacterium]
MPNLFIVQPNFFDSEVFSTGNLSPVSIDSSIAESPFITIQSAGNFSTGFTITISPIINSLILITILPLLLLIRAIFGLILLMNDIYFNKKLLNTFRYIKNVYI